MPLDRDPAHLWDMREAARDAMRFLENLTLAEYVSEGREMNRLAVERVLQILGEAARRVSPTFRDAHPEVPWGDIIGLRNIISHLYDRVDHVLIYNIVTVRIPALLADLEPLVPPPPELIDET
jgi:uncharacterized protein with HEPN domain